MTSLQENSNFSLLRPPGTKTGAATTRLNETDLGLAVLAQALAPERQYTRYVASVLAELCSDSSTILYRQTILEDFLTIPNLSENILAVLPQLRELADLGRNRRWGSEALPLHQVASRLSELDIYLSCVEQLWKTFNPPAEQGQPQSEGLQNFKSLLAAIRESAEYQRLATELPKLRRQLGQSSSVTLGLNLDAALRPESVTLLSINSERFNGKGSLFERLFTGSELTRGLTPLYKSSDPGDGRGTSAEHELYQEMTGLLEKVVMPVAEALSQYTRLNSGTLSRLESELAFFVGAAGLIKELQASGLVLCRPKIAEASANTAQIKGLYNLELALRYRRQTAQNIVPNDLEFSRQATILVLTGPNSGGKTTYTRAVGQAQALFQAGLYVPGTTAILSPVDAIYTHFAAAEQSTNLARGGRLAEELERLANLFQVAGPHSLILLNEPLASTDHASARVLSRDILNGLRLLGARTIYVTHIHELVEDISANQAGAGVVSLVAELTEDSQHKLAPTYRIRPGRPHLLSYAAELARQHGLGLSQISQVLQERGISLPEQPAKEI